MSFKIWPCCYTSNRVCHKNSLYLIFILPVNVALPWLYGILVSNSFNVLVPVVVFHSCNTSDIVGLPFHKHLSTWRFL